MPLHHPASLLGDTPICYCHHGTYSASPLAASLAVSQLSPWNLLSLANLLPLLLSPLPALNLPHSLAGWILPSPLGL